MGTPQFNLNHKASATDYSYLYMYVRSIHVGIFMSIIKSRRTLRYLQYYYLANVSIFPLYFDLST